MKIAQVCPRYSPYIGGVETHVAEISKRLVLKDNDVTVITTDPSGKLPRTDIIDGVKVLRFPSFAPGDAYYLSSSLYSYLKHHGDYDIVHAHGYHAFPAFLASMASRSKLVFTPHYHGKGHTWLRDLLHKPYKLLGGRIFHKAERVICVSEYEKSLVTRDFPVSVKKTVVIPNGVNRQEFLSLTPYQKDMKVLLYVGRLEEYKGVQYAIKALPYLEGYRLVIIGKGPYKEKLIQLGQEEGVAGRVTFLEGLTREELLRWYATADVFIMLSRFEAYGITVAEALSSGKPCVVARSSALTEFIDGASCRGVDLPVDCRRLADEILSSKSGRGYSKKVLDWDDVSDSLIRVYREVQP